MANLADVSIHRDLDGAALRLQWLRTRLFEIAILLWSLPFALVILTVFQIARPPRVVRWALRLWSSGFIFAARWITGVRYEIEGLADLPECPVIFVCNHQSYWESIALTALIPDVNVISKAEATSIPVFGWGLKHAPMIFVDRTRRGGNLRRILREAEQTMRAGRSILIFPEGTRVRPGATLPYQRGLEAIQSATGAPIVPVVHNAGLCWTDGFKTKRAGTVTMRFLPPFAAGRSPSETLRELERHINVEKDRLLDPEWRSS